MGPAAVEDVADEVFGGDLPVALDGRANAATDKLAAALVHIEQYVHIPGHWPQVFLERRSILGKSGEHKALVGGHPSFAQTMLGLVEIAFFIARGLVHTHQAPAVGAE
ncbi:hypothetical protein D3C84_758160 [compost metagenome]